MPRLRRWLRGTIAALILIAMLAAYAWIEGIGIGARKILAGGAAITARDGDTFLIGTDEFRLQGIDAPEYHQSCTDAAGRAWDCGKQARATLAVMLRAPGLTCAPRARDRFGRAIATCSTDQTPDIGGALVRAGFAVSPGQFGEARYAEAEREARDAKRGIWQGAFQAPAEWRKVHPRSEPD